MVRMYFNASLPKRQQLAELTHAYLKIEQHQKPLYIHPV